MNWNNLVLSVLVAALMAACGGGGGNASTPTYDVSSDATFGSGTSGNTGGSGSTSSGSTTTTNVSSNAAGSVILSLTSNQISASQPTTVTAVVKDAAGLPVAGALIQFTLSGSGASGLATVSPPSAITDANGQAAATLTPVSGATVGAAYVNAQADTSAGSLTAKQVFSVTATEVALSSVTLSSSSINGYNSASIAVGVTGAGSTTPVTINVSSTCATAGKATISPSSLTVTGSGGTVTYQDKGCGSTSGAGSATDRISVQIAGTTQQMSRDLVVAAPVTQGIQFVSVDNATICQKGTGCPSVANVVFKTVDQTGVAQPGLTVDFSLNNPVATLGSTFGVTGADGTVSVAVAANRTPSPVRVIAQVRGTSLQTLSNNLTISGGLPVAGTDDTDTGMSFSAEKYALLYEWASDFANLTVRLTDRWGAPAVDGTVVNLVADGGTVVPAYCMTKDGACVSKLLVSNPIPANGRVHVVAYAYGQEYFEDANGNGVFDTGESFHDVNAAVCLDKNGSDTCDASEYIVGNINSLNAGNNAWDDGGAAFARIQHTYFFSLTSEAPRLFKASAGVCTNDPVDNTYMTITMGGESRKTLQFCARDGNTEADTVTTFHKGNPLPSGTTITASPSMANATVSFSNQPISLGVSKPTLHTLTVQNTSPTNAALSAGTATITFTFPSPGYPVSSSTTGGTPTPITIEQKVFINP